MDADTIKSLALFVLLMLALWALFEIYIGGDL
jgi:hypothetical protein